MSSVCKRQIPTVAIKGRSYEKFNSLSCEIKLKKFLFIVYSYRYRARNTFYGGFFLRSLSLGGNGWINCALKCKNAVIMMKSTTAFAENTCQKFPIFPIGVRMHYGKKTSLWRQFDSLGEVLLVILECGYYFNMYHLPQHCCRPRQWHSLMTVDSFSRLIHPGTLQK